MTVMEYAAKFNELSRFSLHQVNTEERKMDHFEQGLRGDIKSVLAGQTFTSYKEMNQRAVKVARVLEETEKETQALNLEKRKQEDLRLNARNQTGKKNKPNYSPGKGKQPMYKPLNPCRHCGKWYGGVCLSGQGRCYGCGDFGHKKSECPKLKGE